MACTHPNLDKTNLESLIVDALQEIAFDRSAPAQSRVAALKELRDLLGDQRDRGKLSQDGDQIDPGGLSLEAIDEALAQP
jgi:hypothetical protein